VSYLSKTLVAVGALGLATVIAIPAAQAEQGDWLIKGGATMVSPKSDNLKLGDLGDVPGVGVVTNASLDVKDATSFGFTITYMYTDNWGVELLAAVPFKHDIKLSANIDGTKGSAKIGETKHLPPTLSLQYHFMPDQMFSPYVGVGANWTIFSSEKLDPVLGTKLSLSDSFGIAGQIGADLFFSKQWFANVDIRYIQIETDAKITDDVGTTKLGTVKINPFVYSLMIGYKF
jgi:outer membrane protein